jgi:hypothetical protein
MNVTNLAATVVAALLFGSASFGQTIQVTGKVTAVTDAQITLQNGTDSWTIKRDATTKVTSGTLSVGQMVTVQCVAPDAQKKEAPQLQPSPTPAGE